MLGEAYGSNISRCVTLCNESSCKINPSLADNCVEWCSNLPQYQSKLNACLKYISSKKFVPPTPPSATQQIKETAPKKPDSPSIALNPSAMAEIDNQKAKISELQESHNAKVKELQESHNAKVEELQAIHNTKVKELQAQIEHLNARLKTAGGGAVVSPGLDKKIEEFQKTYATGRIPTNQVRELIVEIDNYGDEAAAEKFLTYLEHESFSPEEIRRQSAEIALGTTNLPDLFKKVQSKQAIASAEATLKPLISDGKDLLTIEKATVTSKVTTTAITEISPASLLLLFNSDKFGALTPSDVNNLSNTLKTLSLNQKKALLFLLSSVVGDPIRTVTSAGALGVTFTPRQQLFADIYTNLNVAKPFNPPKRKEEKIALDSLNRSLLSKGGIRLQIVPDPAIVVTAASESESRVAPRFTPDQALRERERLRRAGYPYPQTARIIQAMEEDRSLATGEEAALKLGIASTGSAVASGDGPPSPPPISDIPPPPPLMSGPKAPPPPTGVPSTPKAPSGGSDAATLDLGGIQESGRLKGLGYSLRQVNTITTYMKTHPGVKAAEAVQALIAAKNPNFPEGSVVKPGT